MGYEQCDCSEFFGGLGWVFWGCRFGHGGVFWVRLFLSYFSTYIFLVYILPVGLSLTRVAGDFGHGILQGGRQGGAGCCYSKKKKINNPSFAFKFGGKIQVDK